MNASKRDKEDGTVLAMGQLLSLNISGAVWPARLETLKMPEFYRSLPRCVHAELAPTELWKRRSDAGPALNKMDDLLLPIGRSRWALLA